MRRRGDHGEVGTKGEGVRRLGGATNGVLANAGMDVRKTLKRRYGSPEKAEKAVRAAMTDREALEQWASVVTAKTQQLNGGDHAAYPVHSGGVVFSFEEIPAWMRDAAAECLAAAMLAWTAEQEELAWAETSGREL